MLYNKPSYSIDQKVELLSNRGLVIVDEKKLRQYLQHIGYFRLTGYFKFFQDPDTDQFLGDVTFDQVLDTYVFDRKLRLLIMDVIEKIEVSVKANINDYMAEKYGVFWYNDSKFFDQNKKSQDIYLKMCQIFSDKKKKSSSVFVKSYNEKYFSENLLPSWMIFEECTLGEVSTLYKILNSSDSTHIASLYQTYFGDLQLWLLLLVTMRNIAAHHARLWNRRYIIRPRTNDVIFKGLFVTEISWNNKKEVVPNLFNATLIINYLLNILSGSRGHDFIKKLDILFTEFPSINIKAMGFEKDRKQNLK